MTVEKLLTAAEIIGQHGDQATAEWFACALDKWLHHGFALEDSLGLASPGPGQRTARTRYALQLRDHHLILAFAEIDQDLGPCPRCERLAAEITRFMAIIWPRWRDLAEPPDDTSNLRRHLFMAAKATGGELSLSWRRVYGIMFED